MKIAVNDIRNGMFIYKDEQVMQVIEYEEINKSYRLKVMNYETHKNQELNILTTDLIETIVPEITKADLDSTEGDTYLFFDTEIFDFIKAHKNAITNPKWMIDSATCILHSYKGKVYRVDPDRYINVKVTKIEAGSKPIAVFENGTKIAVDSYVRVGEYIKIDTILEKYIDF